MYINFKFQLIYLSRHSSNTRPKLALLYAIDVIRIGGRTEFSEYDRLFDANVWTIGQ